MISNVLKHELYVPLFDVYTPLRRCAHFFITHLDQPDGGKAYDDMHTKEIRRTYTAHSKGLYCNNAQRESMPHPIERTNFSKK
jgi:hypothetical protein